MEKNEYIKMYWKSYQTLEKDFIETDEYVSIDKANYNTFSNQYMKLLMVICSEIDSISDVLCREQSGKITQGFRNKLNKLLEVYPKLDKYRVSTKFPYDIKNIVPLVKFTDGNSDWWNAYNDVKHHRNIIDEGGRSNYMKANLKNVLYALAALYIINCLVYEKFKGDEEITEKSLRSNLFENALKL